MTVRLIERIEPMAPEAVAERYPHISHWVLPNDLAEDEAITFMARIEGEDGVEAIYAGTLKTYCRYVLACAECEGVN